MRPCRAGRVAGTFALLVVGWVVFRADNLADAVRWLGLMFSGVPAQGGSVLFGAEIYGRGPLILMGVSALMVFQGRQGFDWIRTLTWAKVGVLLSLFCASGASLFAQSFKTFLYFQF